MVETWPELSKFEKAVVFGVKYVVVPAIASGLLLFAGIKYSPYIRQDIKDLQIMGYEEKVNVTSNACYVSVTNFLSRANVEFDEKMPLEGLIGKIDDFELKNSMFSNPSLAESFSRASKDFDKYKNIKNKMVNVGK